MASSGTTTFTLQVDDVIEEAYDRCGIESRSGYDLKTAKRSLNLLMQNLLNEYVPLWKVVKTTQSLTQGDTDYTLDNKILEITDAVLRRSGTDTILLQLSRSEYHQRPNKTTQGKPNQFYFEKTSTPTLYVYPAPENSTDTIIYYAKERMEDIGEYTNTIDVPVNALETIVSGLAYTLAVKRVPERHLY